MKIRSAALLLVAASLHASSSAFQPTSSLGKSRRTTAIWATEEKNVETVVEPTPNVAAPKKKSMTERMMAKAPREGQ